MKLNMTHTWVYHCHFITFLPSYHYRNHPHLNTPTPFFCHPLTGQFKPKAMVHGKGFARIFSAGGGLQVV